MARIFVDKPAVREKVPLLIGLFGPSGGGKTFSALRLATGMQRVTGGEIYVIDTESKRACHYADRFKFRHVEFAAPFSPDDYLEAIKHCHKRGAGVIIVDSMSHEHEGPGGVLEWHDNEVERMAKGDEGKAARVNMLAWSKPKAARRRLINSLLQVPCDFIFCFRSKEKVKMEKGKEPVDLGWMPIAGEEFVYEMTGCGLLLPNAGGVPTWQSDYPGERMMMKRPAQFHELLKESKPLDEPLGEAMARWSKGDSTPEFIRLAGLIKSAETESAITALEPELKSAVAGKLVKDYEAENLRSLYGKCRDERKAAAANPGPVVVETKQPATDDPLTLAIAAYTEAGGIVDELAERYETTPAKIKASTGKSREKWIEAINNETHALAAAKAK